MLLYLIRHGRTLPTGPDSHAWPLSDTGAVEAVRLAESPFWSTVAALYCSPEAKALDTVRPSAERFGLPVAQDDRLREVRRTPGWIDEYERAVAAYLREKPEAPVGWEALDAAQDRIASCVRDLETRRRGERLALCSHGLLLALLLGTLEGTLGSPYDHWRAIGFGDVAVVEHGRLLRPFGDPHEIEA